MVPLKVLFIKIKKAIDINEADVEEIVLSHLKSYGKDSSKYFIGYRRKDNAFSSLLCAKLPQMVAYIKYFDKNSKYMNLLANDEKILKKYSDIWNEIKSLIKKEFNSEPVYNDKYIKTKKKIYNNRVYALFRHNKIPKDNQCDVCLSVISLHSIFVNLNKEYYSQIFLEECKYVIKVKES